MLPTGIPGTGCSALAVQVAVAVQVSGCAAASEGSKLLPRGSRCTTAIGTRRARRAGQWWLRSSGVMAAQEDTERSVLRVLPALCFQPGRGGGAGLCLARARYPGTFSLFVDQWGACTGSLRRGV